MSDQEKRVLSLGAGTKPKLELKKPVSAEAAGAGGSVRQSFSRGRSKTVAVEGKQRKNTEKETAEAATRQQQMVKGPEPGTSVSVNERGRATSAVIRQLTPEERDVRARALRGAVLDNEKREADIAAGEAGAEAAGETLRDPLRQREMEELRRIQEKEKTDGGDSRG